MKTIKYSYFLELGVLNSTPRDTHATNIIYYFLYVNRNAKKDFAVKLHAIRMAQIRPYAVRRLET